MTCSAQGSKDLAEAIPPILSGNMECVLSISEIAHSMLSKLPQAVLDEGRVY